MLARIERGDAPRRAWRPSFVLRALAVAAAIAIAVFVAREPRQDVRLKPDTTQAAGPKRRALQLAARPEEPARDASAAAPPRSVDARGPRQRADVEPRPDSNDVPSIAVAPLAVCALTQESMQLEQLDAIAPITVAPLEITDTSRRNQ